jgi:hypothetical protein
MNDKKKPGLANVTEDLRKAIASLGGQAVQRSGRAHRFTSETAKAARRKSSGRKK